MSKVRKSKKHTISNLLILIVIFSGLYGCCDSNEPITKIYDIPTPYELALDNQLPIMNIPSDNPLTIEGVKLGRMLFYDPILSADSTQSCASCHQQNIGFTDKDKFSVGIDGFLGKRRAMPIVNIGYMKNLFWDGRAIGVEDQAIFPVEDPLEMHNIWEEAVITIAKNPHYPDLFGEAFGDDKVTKDRIVKAIAQFERIIISSDSKYDKVVYDKTTGFSNDELAGSLLFQNEPGDPENPGADCFHCHDGGLLTDNLFHNNGLDKIPSDLGLYFVTGIDNDKGKFKTPSLRNVALRAPYMHDGRFATLKEVIDHYSDGLVNSATIDPLMKEASSGGLKLTEEEKWQLVAFLKTMTDTSFINNENYKSPF